MRRALALAVPVALASGLLVVAPAEAAPAGRSVAQAQCRRTLPTYPVLRPGDQGRAVRTLQCTLNDLGVGPVAVDGDYGRQTRTAVAEVEATFEGTGPHSGRIDAGFWVLLFGRQLPHPLPRLGDRGHDVRVLQRALRAAGYRIVVDGDYGAQTRAVVRAYRRHFGSLNFCLRMGCALPQPS